MSNLEKIRLERGLTREELSNRSDIALVTIINYESGIYFINDAPLRLVYPLAVALNCKLADIIENED